ncbi:hypothetical protein MHYP_G00072900 [Metynnis hypsauchen]
MSESPVNGRGCGSCRKESTFDNERQISADLEAVYCPEEALQAVQTWSESLAPVSPPGNCLRNQQPALHDL